MILVFQSEEEKEEHMWSEHTDMAKKQLKKPKRSKNTNNIDTAATINAMQTDETDNLPSCSLKSLSNNIIATTDGLETETNDTSNDLYSCAKCPAVFANQNFLLLHHKTEHSSNAPEHNCDICGQSFELKFSLNQHKQRMHSKDIEPNFNAMETT